MSENENGRLASAGGKSKNRKGEEEKENSRLKEEKELQIHLKKENHSRAVCRGTVERRTRETNEKA